MRRLLFGLALVAVSAQGASAGNLVASSPNGQPVRVGTFGMKNEIDCSSGPLPSAHLNSNPSHGNVTFPEVDYETHTPLQDGNTQCNGTKSHGIAILYTPDPGFRGTDHFEMTLNPWYGQSSEYTVAVVVGGRAPTQRRARRSER